MRACETRAATLPPSFVRPVRARGYAGCTPPGGRTWRTPAHRRRHPTAMHAATWAGRARYNWWLRVASGQHTRVCVSEVTAARACGRERVLCVAEAACPQVATP
ncbi:hypothetical protein EON67_02845 [archaeon]|nr:MAG: hypothetical protein EON67_02845 [archaeon]